MRSKVKLSTYRKVIKNYLEQRKHKNVLIHIGKCGGSTLRSAVKSSKKVSITGVVHIKKPFYFKHQNYYIVIRDPISRCVSAFNWRYRLVVKDESQRERFLGEYDVLKKYQSLNDLAESLYTENGDIDLNASNDFNKIHHLKECISYYLYEFLKLCPPQKIKGVFFQESLSKDIKDILDEESIKKDKENKEGFSNYLSKKAKENLFKYLVEDYQCILKLYSFGLIEKDRLYEYFDFEKNDLS